MPYVDVAGVSYPKILLCHIVLGLINTAVVIATLTVGTLIIAEAAVIFFGAGILTLTPAWGTEVGAWVHDGVHVPHREENLPIRPGGAIVKLVPRSRIFCCG